MIASEHLQPGQIDSFADHELPPDEARAVQQHLATCHPCSLRVLSALNLKQATAAAGHRFDPSQDMLARFTSQLQQTSPARPESKRVLSFPRTRLLWPAMAAAALLLIAISLTTWSVRRSHNALSAELATELLDQHLATLSAAATPQVLSTDRHTVKPWFEGKLSFSFNLPEASRASTRYGPEGSRPYLARRPSGSASPFHRRETSGIRLRRRSQCLHVRAGHLHALWLHVAFRRRRRPPPDRRR